jgi:DNA-directed RNA polymerase sigma subunit (sigma70/sigma32)
VRQIEARALDKLRRALEYQEIERAAGASVH